MHSRKFISLLSTAVIFFTTATAQLVKEPKPWNKEWVESYPPYRIAGNLYYTGTKDLACYFITTHKGHILINTGLQSSFKQIKKSIHQLGFKFSDIKILLTTQAHYDHLGAMAAFKKQTSAKFYVNENDAPEAANGGSSDYALGNDTSSFVPVIADRLLKNGDTIRLGGMELIMLHHPGHTKGSNSFLLTIKDEEQQQYKVLIANMPSIVTDKKFSEISKYPQIAADYAYTFEAMKNISFDIWLASHASQFNMHKKHKPGDGYNPHAFNDQQGYNEALSELKKKYDEKLKQQ
jgi:metallo-beta-lactamase class B